ncbi:MAG: hypothetical protein AB1489_18895 [Acidobacteriota bacterium]
MESKIDWYRLKIRLLVTATAALTLIIGLSFSLGAGSGDHILPIIPFLPLIVCVFIYGVWVINLAMNRYQLEEEACQEIDDVLNSNNGRKDNRNQLISIGSRREKTAIGRRIVYAHGIPDLDTASAILQIPQGVEIEEDKTFSWLQYLRNALVLLGLLSTVISFIIALSSAQADDMKMLIKELQRALTMTMVGVSTSVVLGWLSSVLFDAQQSVKAKIDGLTASMLPRLIPHDEKSIAQATDSTLMLDKLQDYIEEVNNWKNNTNTEVECLTAALVEQRDILIQLPQLELPKGFGELNSTLTKMIPSMNDMCRVVEQALQHLEKERSLDLNQVIELLRDMCVSSVEIKHGHDAILKELIPKQREYLQQQQESSHKIANLGITLEKVLQELEKNANNQKEILTTINQKELVESIRTLEPALKSINTSYEKFAAGIKDLNDVMNGFQASTIKAYQDLRRDLVTAVNSLHTEMAGTNEHLKRVLPIYLTVPTDPIDGSWLGRIKRWLN